MSTHGQNHAQIKEKIFSGDNSYCPLSHPYAYSDGDYCCWSNKEKNDPSAHGALCDGSAIGLDSKCCEEDRFTKCPHPPCKKSLLFPFTMRYSVLSIKLTTTELISKPFKLGISFFKSRNFFVRVLFKSSVVRRN